MVSNRWLPHISDKLAFFLEETDPLLGTASGTGPVIEPGLISDHDRNTGTLQANSDYEDVSLTTNNSDAYFENSCLLDELAYSNTAGNCK